MNSSLDLSFLNFTLFLTYLNTLSIERNCFKDFSFIFDRVVFLIVKRFLLMFCQNSKLMESS